MAKFFNQLAHCVLARYVRTKFDGSSCNNNQAIRIHTDKRLKTRLINTYTYIVHFVRSAAPFLCYTIDQAYRIHNKSDLKINFD